ncbi:MAG: purine-nucleoside/S-methyl-5-thioadenosine phosphorylase / adenosine deaminase [Gaiellaceae bacterium]|jgi:YfiH family protein|nr:purine-nucleoside/S-methyl-5-thioadenosine phosphorylase / adenosine deaminase [Gaiellaceae bacterium]
MADAELIRWDVPGPYSVAFSTRRGGVSEGPYASLNLGRRTGDDVERVDENRRILCSELGADADDLALNFQVHSAIVNRAERGMRGESQGDALWTDVPGLPIAALSADCVPVALARRTGKPAIAVAHAGWVGILGGVLEAAIDRLGGVLDAAIGPSAGPCCYEVGEDVAQPYRERFGNEIVAGGKLDLWRATELALCDAGIESVHRVDICTVCNPDRFFSHRRDGKPRGVQGVVAVVA